MSKTEHDSSTNDLKIPGYSMKAVERIPVTEPFLPPIEQYNKLLADVWTRNWLTNNGPLVKRLEFRLKEYFNLENLLFVNNGTIALQLGIKALGLSGEVITTPFSYVATTSSIAWEGCTPVFVDIDDETLNIDPRKIEESITSITSGIVATHVFGNPCEIDTIREIADRHGLKVIYDAAHCFGTKYLGRSIFEHGDLSATSFHATKLFHTVEGGAVITKNSHLMDEIKYMRNFGHDGPEKFHGVGINGKNSEMHAAMGLCNLDYVDEVLDRRREQYQHYVKNLSASQVRFQKVSNFNEFNYAYLPIILQDEQQLIKSVTELQRNGISPRRYFYPILSNLNYVKKTELPIAEGISKRVLCLPLYHNLTISEIDLISEVLLNAKAKSV